MSNTCDFYMWAAMTLIITGALWFLALLVLGLRLIIKRKRHERTRRKRMAGNRRRGQ